MADLDYEAGDIAAELRRRLPGVGVKKLHKLLYYCQGHHLATFGRRLFRESVAAWDMGPVVGTLWRQEKDAGPVVSGRRLGQAELNTIGYVLSRYGALTGRDLEILTHGEAPWKSSLARREAGGERSTKITHADLRAYFLSDDEDADGESEHDVAPPELDDLLRGAAQRTASAPGRADDLDRLRRRLEELAAVRARHC